MNEQKELCFNVPTEKQLADSQKVFNSHLTYEVSSQVKEKTMTTKELADAFGVDVKTIQRASNSLFVPSTLMSRVINGGESKVYTEKQATAIKIELQKVFNWYTLENLAKATGYEVETLSNGNNGLLYKDFSFVLEHETRLGGYHNTQKYYSQKVLDALQLYKRQAIVNQGNRSVEQKIEIGKELSIGFLTKTVITSGDKKSAEELCNLIMHNTQETAHNAELQLQVATLKPQAQIANDFIDRNHLTNFRDASNILKIKQSDFMKILAEKYIYKNAIGEYRCYAEYEKYFSLRPFQKGIEKTGQQLMLTLEGLEFFKGKIFTEVEA